jgi:hypothetical protein
MTVAARQLPSVAARQLPSDQLPPGTAHTDQRRAVCPPRPREDAGLAGADDHAPGCTRTHHMSPPESDLAPRLNPAPAPVDIISIIACALGQLPVSGNGELHLYTYFCIQ